ncbi:Gag protease polyprotein [Theobroma cacao]|uniref:Gag protease polyprotein n=1 Tax=Theobroma cacao TaxID=3641 RepID=A0A061EHX3_THECC|nr:Gag protease polyprotein [Theobroma cacao]
MSVEASRRLSRAQLEFRVVTIRLITMSPRHERPLPTRSVRRGRGRLRQGQPDLRGEESTASPFRATLAAEPIEIPPPPTGIPAVSPEVPPVVPPVTPSVPLAHDVSISKKLKEARQLGCVSFVGELDATAAKDWINQVSETLSDMRLEDEMKLIVATRLLEKRARTWWNSVKSRSTILLTWSDFLREFDSQYYTHFHQKEKKREFLSLKQGNLTELGFLPKKKVLLTGRSVGILHHQQTCQWPVTTPRPPDRHSLPRMPIETPQGLASASASPRRSLALAESHSHAVVHMKCTQKAHLRRYPTRLYNRCF